MKENINVFGIVKNNKDGELKDLILKKKIDLNQKNLNIVI
mgnify:CR=1 FL=1